MTSTASLLRFYPWPKNVNREDIMNMGRHHSGGTKQVLYEKYLSDVSEVENDSLDRKVMLSCLFEQDQLF